MKKTKNKKVKDFRSEAFAAKIIKLRNGDVAIKDKEGHFFICLNDDGTILAKYNFKKDGKHLKNHNLDIIAFAIETNPDVIRFYRLLREYMVIKLKIDLVEEAKKIHFDYEINEEN